MRLPRHQAGRPAGSSLKFFDTFIKLMDDNINTPDALDFIIANKDASFAKRAMEILGFLC